MNVLSIGNSFSQDAQRYLHRIAKADGVTISSFIFISEDVLFHSITEI